MMQSTNSLAQMSRPGNGQEDGTDSTYPYDKPGLFNQPFPLPYDKPGLFNQPFPLPYDKPGLFNQPFPLPWKGKKTPTSTADPRINPDTGLPWPSLPGEPVLPIPPPPGGRDSKYRNQLEGFDYGKLDDQKHTTPKYVFARIAAKYDVYNPADRALMLKELQADPSGYFKDAKLGGSKNDMLDLSAAAAKWPELFSGGKATMFDIARASGSNNSAWQWGNVYEGTLAPKTTTPPGVVTTPVVVPPPAYTPRDYGGAPVFTDPKFDPYAAPNPYASANTPTGATPAMTEEAYRRLAAQQLPAAPLSALASPFGRRR